MVVDKDIWPGLNEGMKLMVYNRLILNQLMWIVARDSVHTVHTETDGREQSWRLKFIYYIC